MSARPLTTRWRRGVGIAAAILMGLNELELPVALALPAVTGKLPVDRIAGIMAVGGLDACSANEPSRTRGCRRFGRASTQPTAQPGDCRKGVVESEIDVV